MTERSLLIASLREEVESLPNGFRDDDGIWHETGRRDRALQTLDGMTDALRHVAFKANELAQDGLMAKGTGCQIRDRALVGLDARGDEAIRIIRGDYA